MLGPSGDLRAAASAFFCLFKINTSLKSLEHSESTKAKRREIFGDILFWEGDDKLPLIRIPLTRALKYAAAAECSPLALRGDAAEVSERESEEKLK